MQTTIRKATTPASLYRLIYRSREIIAHAIPGNALQHEVRAIVTGSRWRNKTENITGALLFTSGSFAQVLEGGRDVLERTFDRITADRRHTDVTVLSFTPAQRRSFPDWPMAFRGQPARAVVDPFTPLTEGSVLTGARVTTGSDVLRLLEHIVRQEDAWIGA